MRMIGREACYARPRRAPLDGRHCKPASALPTLLGRSGSGQDDTPPEKARAVSATYPPNRPLSGHGCIFRIKC